ncbi:DUF945 family protein [Candidatus Venteria ishoeyi]|uniref:Uncharacterized protein n=1 Tax=Candidatus Venteria ishoeyi TaxID=1899563 RepID=A0A1H6F2Q0_9GAMM|nr:DUF945 family protein [Candidatus Venteria ishoeyi]SEH04342.1 Uncharacterised protein [Candidatus Venteria ishoeyi]
MKKILLAIALLLLLLLIFIPGLTSFGSAYYLENLQQQAQEQPQIENLAWQQQTGWWMSSDEINLKLAVLPETLSIKQQRHHGWLPFKVPEISTYVSPGEKLTSQLQSLLGSGEQLYVHSRLVLDGYIESRWQWQAKNPHQQQDDYFAAQGSLQLQKTQPQLSSYSFIPKIQWSATALPVTINALTINATAQKDKDNDLHHGADIEAHIEGIQLDFPLQQTVQLNNNQWHFGGDIQENQLNLSAQGKVDDIQWENKPWGKAQWQLKLQNLDAQKTLELLKILKKPQYQQRYLLPLFLLKEGKHLLAHNPALETLQLHLQTQDGDVKLSMSMRSRFDAKTGVITDLSKLLKIQGRLELPLAVLEKLTRLQLALQWQMQGKAFDADLLAQQARIRVQEQVQYWVKRGFGRLENNVYYLQY